MSANVSSFKLLCGCFQSWGNKHLRSTRICLLYTKGQYLWNYWCWWQRAGLRKMTSWAVITWACKGLSRPPQSPPWRRDCWLEWTGKPGTASPLKLPCAPVSETHNSEGQINWGLIPLHSAAFNQLFHFPVLIEGMNKWDQWKPFDPCAEFVRESPQANTFACQNIHRYPDTHLPPRNICYLHNMIRDQYSLFWAGSTATLLLGSVPPGNSFPGNVTTDIAKLTKASCRITVLSEIERIKKIRTKTRRSRDHHTGN